MSSMSRRRFLSVSAAAAGLAVMPFARPGRALSVPDGSSLVSWRGQALGAVCELQIHHHDPEQAQELIRLALARTRRLEAMFSLYDENSLLTRLNRCGALEAPPPEFVELMQAATRFAQATEGAFDVTVQPLWRLYEAHFSQPDADPEGPSAALLREALAHVGFEKLVVGRDRVALPRGAAVTLNGVAQGFVTDKIVDLLRAHGVVNSLVDMGEVRAIGRRADGEAWRAGVEDPIVSGGVAKVLPLVDRALSTSGPYGLRFDPAGRFNHLFQPSTGTCAARYASVSVVASSATVADALSTAFCFMEPEKIRVVARAQGVELVHLIDPHDAGLTIRV
ncbi:FAD:protein FMN transferase [Methylocella sp.]|uniref:FAD:protein FMN transferase n=1 Tax=Methylocella sp. TaxID=1978226 RepID=UPI0035B292C3